MALLVLHCPGKGEGPDGIHGARVLRVRDGEGNSP